MPELGKYAAEVLSAYAVSLGLIIALTVMSLRQSVRTRATLQAVEAARQAKADAEKPDETAEGAGQNG